MEAPISSASDCLLALRLGPRRLNFRSVEEFISALEESTAVPLDKISTLRRRSIEELEKELSGIRCVERRCIAALTHLPDEYGVVGAFLEELRPSTISKDHNWRAIIGELSCLSHEFDDYKRAGLVKYVQYLGHRLDVVRSILGDKTRRGEACSTSDWSAAQVTSSVPGLETDLWDFYAPPDGTQGWADLIRLPKAEPVTVHVSPRAPVRLQLGRQRFCLVSHDGLHLVDDAGDSLPLREGRNIVGRNADSSVFLKNGHRTISRTHLIIDVESIERVALTDVSSLGTFLSSNHL